MAYIKKLSPQEAQKIAAGEVVERPANIVKELVENAIDSGATHITIEIEDGGKQLIRVIDDGCGMDEADAQACFEHHATSKIVRIEDLDTIGTFGFRGEALSSIASISKISLITKQPSAEHATKVIIEGAEIKLIEPNAGSDGTDVTIRDLFFNIPARKKFLKKRESEWRHISQLFHAFCFSYLNIHLSLYHDGKRIHICPPVDSLIKRATQLWDSRLSQQLIEIPTVKQNGITLQGIITNHSFGAYDRSSIFFLVNNRLVKNYQLASALLKGYANVLQAGKYPAAVITLHVNSQDLDINTHPRKEEVQFAHPLRITNLIKQQVTKTLEEHLSHHIEQPAQFISRPSAPASFSNTAPRNMPYRTHPSPAHNFSHRTESHSSQDPIKSVAPIHQQQVMPSDESTQEIQIIGQLKKTYILIEHQDGLYIVDQHAAHERILYEQFAQRFDQTPIVPLLFPERIELTADNYQIVQPYVELLSAHGITIEPYGEHTFAIQATPVPLKHLSYADLLQQLIGWIKEEQHVSSEELFKSLTHKIRAQMACKTAVKAGDSLTENQMRKLLDDLNKVDNRFSCPHGRPTSWLMPWYDLEKKFKRDYR